MPVVYEMLYVSGHRQIWRQAEIETASGTPLYECATFSPQGDPLELRILNVRQLQRTMDRVIRSGGQVRTLHEEGRP